MQKRYAFLFILILVTLVSSCKKEENSEFTDSPIIEAYLTPGDYLNVKISRQIPFSSDVTYSSDDLNNLTIQATVNGNVHSLHSLGGGKYIDSSLVVSQGDNYDLSFTFNSKNVKAYTFIPTKPTAVTQSAREIRIARISASSGPPFGGFTMPDPIKITWNNPDKSYYLTVVENIETTLDPIRDFGSNARPSNFFRKQPNSTSSEEIRTREFQYYGKHRIVIYHVLPDYAALYNQSSTSSQNLTNPSTSITNGYGIFTGLSSDTLWVEVKEQ